MIRTVFLFNKTLIFNIHAFQNFERFEYYLTEICIVHFQIKHSSVKLHLNDEYTMVKSN